jgi:mannose-6-phosphate isomerase-like protein (cupin superfamily)
LLLSSPGIPIRELSFGGLPGSQPGTITVAEVFPDEIQGLVIDTLDFRGPARRDFPADGDTYTVLLVLDGQGTVHIADKPVKIAGNSLVRIPYNQAYSIEATTGQVTRCLRLVKKLDEQDKTEIRKDVPLHARLYAPEFSDCPAYHENIKSAKTLSRMLLPEGYVPRFCMGAVETTGPDEVGAHEHPMLEQLFFGLKDCHATCHADQLQTQFKENTLLHIPLGSRHSVSVDEGNVLSYIWFDFFLSLAGQSYMSEQHKMVGPDKI